MAQIPLIRISAILFLITTAPAIFAQATTSWTLDSVLERLEENSRSFDTSLPSFLCEEHIVSEVQAGLTAAGFQRVSADSTFRIVREESPDHTLQFDETRIVHAINGKPSSGTADEGAGPIRVTGIFTDANNMMSRAQEACYRYTLQLPSQNHPKDPIVIDFSDLPKNQRDPQCGPYEETSGRVMIDPTTMQIARVERKVPHRLLLPGTMGVWTWEIDYAPVVLGNQRFWMPQVIHSTADGERTTVERPHMSPGYIRVHWSYVAHYSGYHLFHVQSRILPAGTEDLPEGPVSP